MSEAGRGVSGFPRSFGGDFFGQSGSGSRTRSATSSASALPGIVPILPAPVLPMASSSLAQAQGSLLLPDIPNPDNGQWAADCGAYAFDKVCGYAAAVCFLGKVAGVVGTDEEIEQARSVIKSAFRELGNVLFGGSDDIRALRREQAQLDRQVANYYYRDAQLDPGTMFKTPESEAAHHEAFQAALNHGDYSKLEALRKWPLADYLPADRFLYSDAYIDNLKDLIPAKRRLEEVKQKRRLLGDRDIGDVIGDYFKGLWDSIKKIYDELLENINNGRWKYGLCKAGIDTGFFILDEGVSLAVVAALTALGLGAAGVLLKIATTVVVQGAKVARRLADVKHIRLNLSFTRQHARGQPFDAHGTQQVSRNTDVKPHELTDEHKKLFDERYQGNLDATPDAYSSPPPRSQAAKPTGKKPDFSRITEKDKQLARTVGDSAAQVEAREKIVKVFAEETGIPAKHLNNMIDLEKGGIDLTKPLEIKEFKQGDMLTQWYDPKSPRGPGNWVDPIGSQHPSSLGISPEGRVQQVFRMEKDGYAIESVARKVTDTWTNPSQPYKARGEGTQWFIPDQYKPTLEERFGSPIKTWREIPFEIP